MDILPAQKNQIFLNTTAYVNIRANNGKFLIWKVSIP